MDDDAVPIEVIIKVTKADDAQVERLRDVGVDVHSVLSTIGVVSGAIGVDRLDDVAGVDGVESVERSRKVSATGSSWRVGPSFHPE